jgi:hypothetical protein
VVRIVADKALNLRKPSGKGRAVKAAIAEESEAGLIEHLNLGPLLCVTRRWSLERSTHLMEGATAPRAYDDTGPRCDLEALAAGEAGVRHEIGRSDGSSLRRRRKAIAYVLSKSSASSLLGRFHAGPNA